MSSMYPTSVVGVSLAEGGARCTYLVASLAWNSSYTGDAYMIDSAGEMGDPCGMPFSTGLESDMWPSRQIAASLFDRNELTHLTMGSGVSQSVDLGRSNNPNTTPTKDYEIVQVVVYLRGVQRGCAEEGERGSTPTG